MVFDRTINDVTMALELVESKVKNFIELTGEELDIMERGSLTLSVLNRIENKQSEIKYLIDKMLYFSPPIHTKNWTINDIFLKSDIERWCENISVLSKSFYTMKTTPPIPKPLYGFQEINDIEKILYDLSTVIDDMISKYRQCGTFYCGEVNEN